MVLAAVGQFCATSSIPHNAAIVELLVLRASKAGARVLFLPEASDYIAGSPLESIKLAEPVETSIVVNVIRKMLKRLPMSARPEVSIGVHEPATESTPGLGNAPGTKAKRVKNTLLWIDSNGEIKHRYQKIHLFDVDISNGPILKESKSVEPGNEVGQPFDTPIGKGELKRAFLVRPSTSKTY